MTYTKETPTDCKVTTPLPTPPRLELRGDPLLGRLFAGRYRMLTRIGRGGMATVYLARRLEDDCLCAVKIMHRFLIGVGRFRERWRIEIDAAARIAHPNIVRILDHGDSDDGLLYMAMELVEGRCLRTVIDEASIGPSRACWIAAEIASALEAAHAVSVVHRDLKPENVFLVQDLERGSEATGVKVLDFGIAKLVDAPSITSKLHVLGTPEYLSPEQAIGDPVDGRSDLYGLGVILYEMLTQTIPFSASSIDELLQKHITETPEPPGVRAPDAGIPPDLDHIVLACLSKNREARPQSATALRKLLLEAASTLGEEILF